MSLVGVCSICSGPAMNTCRMCGKLACRGHYDPATGLCANCAQKKGPGEPMVPLK